jgi:hypothetical protein
MRTMPALLLLASVLATPSRAADPERSSPSTDHPDLSGTWRFNAEESDDLREKMREIMQGGGREGRPGRMGPGGMGPGGMGGPRGGFGGGGRGGFGGRGGRPGDEGAEGEARRGRGFAPPEELTITQEEAGLRIVEKEARNRLLVADGKSHKDDNGLGDVKASWSDQRLVVETKRENGRKTKEAFALARDGAQIHVLLEFETPFGDKIKVRRVYDRAERAPAAAPAPPASSESAG